MRVVKIYGKLSKHKVKTVNFKKLIKKYDLIKIDIEGAEKKIIETTSIADWKKLMLWLKYIILKMQNLYGTNSKIQRLTFILKKQEKN